MGESIGIPPLASGWANFVTRLRRWITKVQACLILFGNTRYFPSTCALAYGRRDDEFYFAHDVFYSPCVHPYFLWRFSALCGLFLSNRTHVWVPISLSSLVAFAPAGDREMGTKVKNKQPDTHRAIDGHKESKKQWLGERKKRLIENKEKKQLAEKNETSLSKSARPGLAHYLRFLCRLSACLGFCSSRTANWTLRCMWSMRSTMTRTLSPME